MEAPATRYVVRGASMYPTLRDGDVVTVHPDAYATDRPAVGHLVLVHHPFKKDVRMVKRVGEVLPDGRVFVVGDCPLESEDSRGFGALRPDAVIGRVHPEPR